MTSKIWSLRNWIVVAHLAAERQQMLMGLTASLGWLLGCAGDPHVELKTAALFDDQLLIVLESSTLQWGPRAESKRNVRAYLARYSIPHGSDTALLEDAIEIDSDAEFRPSSTAYHLACDGHRVVRLSGLGVSTIEGKLYATADVEVFGRDRANGEWRKLRAWQRRPVLLSPVGCRMVIYDEQPRAYDLENLNELNVDGLESLFAGAGSGWHREIPEIGEANLSFDNPPDYLGLTRDFNYGSADRGNIYAGFIYERAKRSSRALPRSVVLTDLTSRKTAIDVLEVGEVGEIWHYLCAGAVEPGNQRNDPHLFVIDERGRIIGALPSARIDDFPFPNLVTRVWNPQGATCLFYINGPSIPPGLMPFKVWRYGDSSSSLKTWKLDIMSLFELANGEYRLKAKAKTQRN